MFEALRERGFQVQFLSHAEAILGIDFKPAVSELEAALREATIPIEEIIAGGGGESKGTQRLRKALTALAWPKFTFTIEKRINGTRIALEIEWNNKDPFYDRDLENFKRLHADGAISVGIIITRGRSLHDNMRPMVRRFLAERQINSLEDIRAWGYDPTARQRAAITERTSRARNPVSFHEAFTDKFVADKFGEATTHWRKLEDRVHRGVGNPCPLLLIGLPDSIVTFNEGKSALAEIEADETEDTAGAP
jgi:hypothetical protein